jgi:Spy/CpxP family protein refolding chaperone
MRKVIILSTAAALVIGLASASLFAQGRGGPGRGEGRDGRPNVQAGDNQGSRRGGPGGPGRRGGRFGGGPGMIGLGRNLDLTADQRTKVQELMRGSRDQAGPIVDQLRVAQNNLRRELFADTTDEVKVKEFTAKVTELRSRMADIRISASASIAEVLTPEQREKMRVGVGRGPGAQRGGPGRGRGRGPGPARG